MSMTSTPDVHELLARESLALTEVWRLLDLADLDVAVEEVTHRIGFDYYVDKARLLELVEEKAAPPDDARADESDYTTRDLPRDALSTRII